MIIVLASLLAITTLLAVSLATILTWIRRKPTGIGTTLTACGFAWAIAISTFASEMVRVQELRRLSLEMGHGGVIDYEPVYSTGLTWPVKVLGVEFVRDEREVDIYDREALALSWRLVKIQYMNVSAEGGLRLCDSDVAMISRHRNLKELWIEDDEITTRGLSHLANIKTLDTLVLNGSMLDDDAASPLARCLSLKRLLLFECHVGDDFLIGLSGHRHLRTLSIENSGISDYGLYCLSRLPELRALRLTDSCITDKGLTSLKDIAMLNELSLRGSMISDVGMSELAKCRELRVLDVGNTSITEKGLAAIAPLVHLQILRIDETDVSDGVLQVVESFPELRQLWVSSKRLSPETHKALQTRVGAGVVISND